MPESHTPPPNVVNDAFGNVTEEHESGEVITRIHPAVYTLVAGGFAVVLACLAFVASLNWMAFIDLPVNFVLFLVAGTICLGSGDERPETVPGVVLAGIGVVISCVHLLIANDHPWLY